MHQGLQKNARRNSETSATYEPVTLTLNGRYIEQVTDAVNACKAELRICAYAWRWYFNNPELGMQKFNIAVLRARQRGVTVKVLCDNSITHQMLKEAGISVKFIDANTIMHIKAIACDVDKLFLGSHNLTKNATTKNMEASVVIREYEPIAQFIKYFDGIWGQLGEN